MPVRFRLVLVCCLYLSFRVWALPPNIEWREYAPSPGAGFFISSHFAVFHASQERKSDALFATQLAEKLLTGMYRELFDKTPPAQWEVPCWIYFYYTREEFREAVRSELADVNGYTEQRISSGKGECRIAINAPPMKSAVTTFAHELLHAVVQTNEFRRVYGKLPVWLDEGLAEGFSWDSSAYYLLANYHYQLLPQSQAKPPKLEDTFLHLHASPQREFTYSSTGEYFQGAALVHFLSDGRNQKGLHKLLEMAKSAYNRAKKREPSPFQASVADYRAAISEYYPLTLDELQTQLNAYVAKWTKEEKPRTKDFSQFAEFYKEALDFIKEERKKGLKLERFPPLTPEGGKSLTASCAGDGLKKTKVGCLDSSTGLLWGHSGWLFPTDLSSFGLLYEWCNRHYRVDGKKWRLPSPSELKELAKQKRANQIWPYDLSQKFVAYEKDGYGFRLLGIDLKSGEQDNYSLDKPPPLLVVCVQ